MGRSLRNRLLFLSLCAVVSTWLISILVTASFAKTTVLEQIDRQLQQYMSMVNRTFVTVLERPETKKYFWERVISSTTDGIATLDTNNFTQAETELATNIWISGIQIISRSDAPRLAKPQSDGVYTQNVTVNGEPAVWRVLYQHNAERDIWIAVAIDLRGTFGRDLFTAKPTIPLLLALPVTLLLLWWAINRGLAPLGELRTKIESRSPTALDPIELEQIPEEMASVVEALNRLLKRLERALESETRFTSHAAHELQTPLASIKAEVQRQQRHCRDAETSRMLDRIYSRVNRSIATVRQLLTLARLDPDQAIDMEPIALDRLILDVVAEEVELALEKQISVNVDGIAPVVVNGHEEWLRILVANLVINAFKYCPPDGRVRLSSKAQSDGIHIDISNDCAEITPAQFERLTDRFYSLPGSGGDGVGLGLSIAQRIVELHSCELRLMPRDDRGGFRVEIVFDSAC